MKLKCVIISLCLMAGIQSINALSPTMEAGKYSLLTNTGYLPSTNGHLLTIPNLGLFYTDEGILYPLDSIRSQKVSQIRFKDNFPFDELIVSDSTFLVKSQQYVLKIDANSTKIVTELDTDAFDIYSGHDGIYNLVVQEDSTSWAWYRYDLNSQRIECVIRMNEPISLVVDANVGAFCLIGKRIYMVTSESMSLLVEAQEPILDMVMTRMGLLLCTAKVLYIINADLQAEVSALGPFHSLYYDNGILYVVLQNGDIMKTDISDL